LLQTSIYARSTDAVASAAKVLSRTVATVRIRVASDYDKTAVESHPVPRWSLQKFGSQTIKPTSSSGLGSHRRATSKSCTHLRLAIFSYDSSEANHTFGPRRPKYPSYWLSSPQSLTPFLSAIPAYQTIRWASKSLDTEQCLKKSTVPFPLNIASPRLCGSPLAYTESLVPF
jgi:hypothetical protein